MQRKADEYTNFLSSVLKFLGSIQSIRLQEFIVQEPSLLVSLQPAHNKQETLFNLWRSVENQTNEVAVCLRYMQSLCAGLLNWPQLRMFPCPKLVLKDIQSSLISNSICFLTMNSHHWKHWWLCKNERTVKDMALFIDQLKHWKTDKAKQYRVVCTYQAQQRLTQESQRAGDQKALILSSECDTVFNNENILGCETLQNTSHGPKWRKFDENPKEEEGREQGRKEGSGRGLGGGEMAKGRKD